MSRRRPLVSVALFTIFIVVPLIEIYVLIQVGQVIGPWWTILLLVLDSILGTWLIKREGGRTWRALRDALDGGRMPGTELADGALVLIGGTLMLAPGFVSDIAGLICVLPFTRPLVRGALVRFLTRRFLAPGTATVAGGLFDPAGPGATRTRQRPGPDGVVQGEVIDRG